MKKALIICGPTATGKTKLALQLAKELNGELVSADSRQVYLGNDIETGKDKDIIENSRIKIWLLDILNQNEEFSVSAWRKLAKKAISDILSRDKLPIIVGGSGLYIKSLIQELPDIDVPYDTKLRKDMENKSAVELFNYLKSLNSQKADLLNNSDKHNKRRLIRSIEISTSPSTRLGEGDGGGEVRGLRVRYLQVGLTAPKNELIKRIKTRVADRGLDKSFEIKEINIMKNQLVWFKKQPHTTWFDISTPGWDTAAIQLAQNWYNNR